MKKMGLVLAGGGSLGAYQVGAIKALLENGYKFDVVTGTSIGALNATFISTGKFDDLEKLWLNITPENVIKNGVSINVDKLMKPSSNYYMKLMKSYLHFKGCDISPFKELCKNNIDIEGIKKSKVLCGVVATKFPIFKEKRVILNEIPDEYVLPYLHASSACYPIFPLEKIDGDLYIDGGYRNNLPIDFCFELGADEIIAINLPMPNMNIKNKYMLNLHNVKIIQPENTFPMMMDFEHNFILKLMKLGYLDTRKFLRITKGYKYYIKAFEFEKDINLELFRRLIKDDDIFLREIVAYEAYQNNSLIITVLEKLASLLKIEFNEEYEIQSLVKMIGDNIDNLNKKYQSLYFIIRNAMSNYMGKEEHI